MTKEKLVRELSERLNREFVGIDFNFSQYIQDNIEEAVSGGTFRADLYYRLNVIPLHVPPLRERGEDILLLFDHFARRTAGPGRPPVRAAADLQHWMLQHSWPGNCRELLNFVERISVLWPGEEMSLAGIPSLMLPRRTDAPPPSAEEQRAVLEMWDSDADEELQEAVAVAPDASTDWHATLPGPPKIPGVPGALASVDLKKLLAEYEEAWIRASLRETLGNITHSADLLGLPRTTFIERLRKYGLSASRQ